MLIQALADPDPVIIFEHVMLLNTSGEVLDKSEASMEKAIVRRQGADVSLITYGGSLPKALAAAKQLQTLNISAEVVDLRCLRPLDIKAIVASVTKTHRAIIIDEAWLTGSLAGEISAIIMDQAFWHLDAPVKRLCTVEVPIPYPSHLEQAALPQVDQIVSAAQAIMAAR
jgi:pyruvate/2-oxoglutarate/acetoin dehydrogenase E1 component